MPILPLLQDTPNTVNYLIAGYAVLIGLPLLYIATWYLRQRSLEKDLELLKTLETDRPPAAAPGKTAMRDA
jgi:hypothetical protein